MAEVLWTRCKRDITLSKCKTYCRHSCILQMPLPCSDALKDNASLVTILCSFTVRIITTAYSGPRDVGYGPWIIRLRDSWVKSCFLVLFFASFANTTSPHHGSHRGLLYYITISSIFFLLRLVRLLSASACNGLGCFDLTPLTAREQGCIWSWGGSGFLAPRHSFLSRLCSYGPATVVTLSLYFDTIRESVVACFFRGVGRKPREMLGYLAWWPINDITRWIIRIWACFSRLSHP